MTPATSYYFFVGVGLFLGTLVFFTLALTAKRPVFEIAKFWLFIMFFSALGAKIFHTLFEAKGHVLPNGEIAQNALDLLSADPWHWVRFFSPGYVFFGGLIFGLLGLAICVRVQRVPNPLQYTDFYAQGLTLALFMGRIGCFCAGCCFGIGALPIQLFEAAFSMILFTYLYKKNSQRHGEKFEIFLSTYAIFRFMVEFLRADAERGVWFGLLSTSQIISLFLLFCLLTWKWLEKPRLQFAKLR